MWIYFSLALIGAGLTLGCAPAGPQSEGQGTSGQTVEKEGSISTADGISLAYSEKGMGSTAVVFIHGWSCDRSYWDRQVDAVAARYRMVRLDLPGHGASGSERQDWTIEAFGRDLRALADQLKLNRLILVGHSMGGPVALEAARQLPGRVTGVIGVDSLHDADFQWNEESWKALLSAYEKDFSRTCDRFVRSMFLPGAPQELVQQVAGDMCETDPAVGIALLRVFPTFDTAAALQALSIPIRCINAPGLPTNIEGNRRYADYDARFMEGVGHFLMLERPDEFNRLLLETLAEIAN